MSQVPSNYSSPLLPSTSNRQATGTRNLPRARGAKHSKHRHGRSDKKTSDSVQNLISFMSDRQLQSTIITNRSTKSNLTAELPKNANFDCLFLLVFGTNSECKIIFPIFIQVKKHQFKVITDMKNGEIYVKFRLNHFLYVGKVMIASSNREKCEIGLESAISSLKNTAATHFIVKEQALYSCTKPCELLKIDANDKKQSFLKALLRTCIDTSVIDDTMCEKYGNHEQDTENDMVYHDNNIPEISANDIIVDDNAITTNDSGFVHDISSDDQSANCNNTDTSNNGPGPRKKSKKSTDLKIMAKIRDDRSKRINDLNNDIIFTLEKLNETIPTMPISEQSTPVIKNLFSMLTMINEKMNLIEDKKSLKTKIPLKRVINTLKLSGTNEIRIGDKVTFPLDGYVRAIEGEGPHLIISRFIRFCFPYELKTNCDVNEECNEDNFLWRIGSENLFGKERVADGREIIDMLIEHAHALYHEESMDAESIHACNQQVDKALYDHNRKDRIKKRKICSDETATNDHVNDPRNEEPASYANGHGNENEIPNESNTSCSSDRHENNNDTSNQNDDTNDSMVFF